MKKYLKNRQEVYRRMAFTRTVAGKLTQLRDRTTTGKMLGMSRQQVEYHEMRALYKLIHELRVAYEYHFRTTRDW